MTIYEFIKKNYLRLSKGQRKVAQFILDQPQTIVSNVASEVGRLAGVSESTVIRFCYAIDLGGYNELQAKLQEYLTVVNVTSSPKIEKAISSDIVKTGMLNQIKHVSKVIEKLDSKQVAQSLQLLGQAKQIFVLGFNENEKYAHFFTNNGQFLGLENIEKNELAIPQAIVNFQTEDALLVFSEKDLQAEELAIIEEAAKKQMKIILIHMQPKHIHVKKCDAHIAILSHDQSNVAAYSVLLSLIEVLGQMRTQNIEIVNY
jgi:DNA-binding MurR/RpiR family transcriptional regulator